MIHSSGQRDAGIFRSRDPRHRASAGRANALAGKRSARRQIGSGAAGLIENGMPIRGMHCRVTIAVKSDRPHCRSLAAAQGARIVAHRHRSAGHRLQCGQAVVCRSRRQPGVHSYRGEQLRIESAEDHRHRAARGHAGDIDMAKTDVMQRTELACRSSNQSRFAAVGELVLTVVPIPANQRVSPGRLLRVQHQGAVFVGDVVHVRDRGELIGTLHRPMQHDEQRRVPARSAR